MEFLKGYRAMIIIPSILGYLVYADYSHTQEWKAKQQKLTAQTQPQ